MQYKATYITKFTDVNSGVLALLSHHFEQDILKECHIQYILLHTPRWMGVYKSMLKRMRTPGVKVRLFIVQTSISCPYVRWFTLRSVIF